MNLECIILNEVTQSQEKKTRSMYSLICGIWPIIYVYM